MNTSFLKREQLVFAYPVSMGFETEEMFVTLDEPNLFVEPNDNIWIKLAATITYLIGLCGCFVQYIFVVYEMNGYAASFRTAMNQLVSSSYILVSFAIKTRLKRLLVLDRDLYFTNA